MKGSETTHGTESHHEVQRSNMTEFHNFDSSELSSYPQVSKMGWKRKKLAAIDDEDLCDVHLVGTDGEEVPCCKAYLAPMSPVFKAMFFKGFREQKTDRCSLDFHSLVISVIVKYCYVYCGREVDMDLIFSKDKSIEEVLSLLLELRKAGSYFEIQDLSAAAEAKIGNLVFQRKIENKKYQYVSAFLTELFKRGEDEEPLGRAIYQFAYQNTMECFGPGVPEINSINHQAHPRVLSKVLQETKDTYAVVRCLQTWFSLENQRAGFGYSEEEKGDLIEIAKNVDLKRLPRKKLLKMKPCSLFSGEKILEALADHGNHREATRRSELHILGAGMKHLDGIYEPCEGVVKQHQKVFWRFVEHNGIPCRSVIHRKYKENRWLISITKCNSRFKWEFNSDDELYENHIQVHVYESPCQSLPTEDPKIPPFNNWKCIECTGEAPYVAYL